MEEKINNWCNRWLSSGEILALVQSLLETFFLFFQTLAYIPKRVLEHINIKVFRFLWFGKEWDGRCLPEK